MRLPARGHAHKVPKLSRDLAGPVPVALAQSVEAIPQPPALPGGCLYEMKFDGYRAVIVRTVSRARIWSRQGVDLSSAFPDLIAAAEFHLKAGTVLDGEICIWNGGRLSFELLQRRMARRHGPAIHLAAREHPATYVAFDMLASGGDDLRRQPLRSRRSQLERAAARWAPPMELSPATADRAEALAWFEDYRPAGIEGVMAKASDGRYEPGQRRWLKVKSRQTQEVIVGAVVGPLHKPASLVAGLISGERLIVAGRSTRLTAQQSG